MSFNNELPDGEKEAMKALKRLTFQTNKTFRDGKYSITVEDMRVYLYYEDDCIGDFELTDIRLLTNLLLDTIEYEEDFIEEMKKINKEKTEPVDNYTDLFDDEKEEDNMSKNSLITRIQEKYTSLNKEYHQLKKEIETDKSFKIEAWIDNETNYLNIKINNYDEEYTRVYQAFKNIEETYGKFDKVEWGSMYIIGRYKL